MEHQTKEELFGKLKKYIETKDSVKLRDLSNECSDAAFVEQDKDIINIGIIAYGFYKIFLKKHYQLKFDPLLQHAIRKLSDGNLEAVIEDIRIFDTQHGHFQGNVVKRARIKIGARLYTRGLSLSKAAEMVSVNISDILEYSGGTQIHDKATSTAKSRLETARKIFE